MSGINGFIVDGEEFDIKLTDADESRLAAVENAVAGKQAALTAGEGITLSGSTISVTPSAAVIPVPNRVVASTGETFTLRCPMRGEQYRWQISTNLGASWVASTADGNNTDTLSVSATVGRNKFLYRCMVTTGGETKYSDEIILLVLS